MHKIILFSTSSRNCIFPLSTSARRNFFHADRLLNCVPKINLIHGISFHILHRTIKFQHSFVYYVHIYTDTTFSTASSTRLYNNYSNFQNLKNKIFNHMEYETLNLIFFRIEAARKTLQLQHSIESDHSASY